MKRKINLTLMLCGLLVFAACDDDDDSVESGDEVNFIQNLLVGDNTYLSGFKNLDVEELDNTNAYVHSKTANMVTHNDYFLLFEREEDKIHKYVKTDNGIEKEGTALILPANSSVSSICIVNDTIAYATLSGVGQVAIINPEEMTLKQQIDITSYALGKENNDNNPEPVACIARDGKLFVFLWQEITEFYPYEGAYTIVIDIASNEVDKMISDMRGTMLCGMPAGESFIDENGDIYVYAQGGFGYFPQYKEGFLRIKKGETDYDSDYFFSINETSIDGLSDNSADYVNQYVYTEDGIIYGYVNVPGYASNPPDYTNDRTMQPCKIDVYNQTAEKLNLPASTGWSSCITIASDDNILFGMVSSDGSGYYQYNYKTETSLGKTISTEGAPFRIFEFK